MLFPAPSSLLSATLLLTSFVSALPTGPSGELALARRATTAAQKAKVAAAAASSSASASKSKSLSLSKSKSASLSRSRALAAVSKKTTTTVAKVVKTTTTKTTTTKAAVATSSKLTTTTTTTSKPQTTTTTTTKSTTTKTTTTKTTTTAPAAIKTLAAGTSFIAGTISSTFKWQSSGILTSGCPQDIPGLAIKACYHGHLAESGMLQSTTGATRKRDWDAEADAAMYDDHTDSYFEAFPEQLDAIHADVMKRSSHEGLELYKRQVASCTPATSTPTNETSTGNSTTVPVLRQRIEMFSWPGVPAGETWTYNWKSYQAPGINTTSQFFHSWQLLRRDGCSGPVIASDLQTDSNGTPAFSIADYITARRCTGANGGCPSIPMSAIVGKTMAHTVTVTFGLSGSFNYQLVDAADATATPLMTYSATGDMGASGSLKFGNYRRAVAGISEVDTYVGDYSAVRLS